MHEETMDEAMNAISAVRAVEYNKDFTHYNCGKWNDGDFRARLSKRTATAKKFWQKAIDNRGETRLGQTNGGSSIHLIRARVGQNIAEALTPECRYKQKSDTSKAMFGPGSSITKASGKAGAEEVITWIFGAGHLRLCPGCAKHLSLGGLAILENGGIGT